MTKNKEGKSKRRIVASRYEVANRQLDNYQLLVCRSFIRDNLRTKCTILEVGN